MNNVNILIGNVLAFIAAMILIYTGILKKKKQIIFYQTINIALYAISNLVLGGVVGFINNILNIVRNILCYKDKLDFKWKIIITVITIILTICFNNISIIGLLPSISALIYLWYMDVKDVKKFKLLIAFVMIFWVIYDFYIKSYVGALFDLCTVIVNLISCYRIKQ